MVESIGKRIAFLRQKNGWTQQSFAIRVAISRVAVSHIEMDLTIPSERSITLMAGVFKLSPIELVRDTSYPKAKAEHLPEVTNTFTDLELQYALLNNDLEWLHRLDNSPNKSKYVQGLLDKWLPLSKNWNLEYSANHEKIFLMKMRQILNKLEELGSSPEITIR
jgi:transcriptional regulator with XRE-family HTH domain